MPTIFTTIFSGEEELEAAINSGDPSKGYQWKDLFLPNGTKLRMTYQGRNHYAEVRNERLKHEGEDLSPSQFACKIADNTSRNAWRDLWVKLPGKADWQLADNLRSELRREKARELFANLKSTRDAS